MNTTSATTPKYLHFHQVLPLPEQPETITTTSLTDEELMDTEAWDWDNAVTLPPVKRKRSVLSVAFSAEQFEAIGEAAEALGMKLSAFVREAALRAARR